MCTIKRGNGNVPFVESTFLKIGTLINLKCKLNKEVVKDVSGK